MPFWQAYALRYTRVKAVEAFIQIYRCWMVFDKSHKWLVVFPTIILWCSGFVCDILLVYYYATAHLADPAKPLLFARLVPHALPLWTTFYCCDIAMNVYTTGTYLVSFLTVFGY
jgi:hypothetical protein